MMLPADACDAHLHVFDATRAGGGALAKNATLADYRQVQQRLGTSRAVIVQPRLYGTDNSVTLTAIKALGQNNARGIAVLHPDVTEQELQTLHDAGIRGVRFSLHTADHAAVSFDMVEPLAHRIKALGWHLQLHWTADQIAANGALLLRLPIPIVFDHMARLPVTHSAQHPAFAIVRTLLSRGNTWIKLSAPYLCSANSGQTARSIGSASQAYADVLPLARTWVDCAPDRLLWGSDWPHVTECPHPPDAVELLNLLGEWTQSDAIRQRILVDNPATLYGFNND
jgi:D-galactarolactone isomerase